MNCSHWLKKGNLLNPYTFVRFSKPGNVTNQKQTPKDLYQIQIELGIDLVKQAASEMSDAILEIAFLDEKSPHFFYLRELVCTALDTGPNTAQQIVVSAIEEELKRRKGENWSSTSLLPPR